MPSVTIGSDGLGLIAYYYCGDINLQNGTCAPTSNLRVAHCSDTNCTAATITDLDTEGTVGELTTKAVFLLFICCFLFNILISRHYM